MKRTYRPALFGQHLEQRSLLALTPIGNEFLANDPTIGDQFAEADSVDYLEDGRLIVSYSGRSRFDEDGVSYRIFDSSGSPLTSSLLANQTLAGSQGESTVKAMSTGGFVMVWEGRGATDQHGIFARWYDASGNPLTAEIQINQTSGGTQSLPQVAVASDGTAVFVWHGVGTGDFDGVFTRRFDASGNALTAEQLVNVTTTNEQAFADVAIANDGSALVTWSSRHQDGSDWGIYARRLDASGTPIGSEFQVNSESNQSQVASSVTESGNGFVVAWQSWNQDQEGWAVVGRQISGDGQLSGEEFMINTTQAGNQIEVELDTSGTDQLVAIWSDGQTDGEGWNVSATEIMLTGQNATVGEEVTVNSGTASNLFGHQNAGAVVASVDALAVCWFGDGPLDHDGVYIQEFENGEPNLPPNLLPIPDQTASVGIELVLIVTATDPNEDDELTFFLDPETAPAGATITPIGNRQAEIRWTPVASDSPGPVQFRVLVADDGQPPLADSEGFLVTFDS